MERSGIVTLTTDFGLTDTYVGVLKGVVWGIFPQARIVDLTHQIEPQAVLQGAFLLATSYRYFPRGTVHLAVVDPGVGTDRPAIAVATPEALFVAPDNGLLTFVWEDLTAAARAASRIVELTERRFWLPQVSSTFHGRDIFAPVAAHLAAGVKLEEVGQPRDQIVLSREGQPLIQSDGVILGRIVHVDRFGNCISNVERDRIVAIAQGDSLHCQVGEHRLEGLTHTYAEGRPDRPLALIGSSGRLEIAVRNGNAASDLSIAIGDPIRVWRESRDRSEESEQCPTR